MIGQMLLVSSLAALPLSPLPGQDRHGQMHDRLIASEVSQTSESFNLAQYAPAGGGGPMMGGQMGPRAEGMPGPGMMHGAMPGPGMMHALNLTEAQRDAILAALRAGGVLDRVRHGVHLLRLRPHRLGALERPAQVGIHAAQLLHLGRR